MTEPTYPTGRERRPVGRNYLRYFPVVVLFAILALFGMPVWSSAATVAPNVTPALTFEVVTANAAGTWLTVQGPMSQAQAKAVRARLLQTKFNACRLHLPACSNIYDVYLATKAN